MDNLDQEELVGEGVEEVTIAVQGGGPVVKVLLDHLAFMFK